MTTIIHRNAFVFKTPPPPEVAYYISHHGRAELKAITWADVMAARRERQERILRIKRSFSEIRAIRIHVRFFDQDLYGGWHTYIDGVCFSTWIRRSDVLQNRLMSLFPLQSPKLPFTGDYSAWYEWQEGFAREHQRGTFCKRPRGVAYAWARVSGRSHIEDIISTI